MYVCARACAFRRYTRIMTEQKKNVFDMKSTLKNTNYLSAKHPNDFEISLFSEPRPCIRFLLNSSFMRAHAHTHTEHSILLSLNGPIFRTQVSTPVTELVSTPGPKKPARHTRPQTWENDNWYQGTKVPRYQGRWSHVQWGLASFRVEREREVGKLTTEPNRSSTRHHSRNYCLKKFH